MNCSHRFGLALTAVACMLIFAPPCRGAAPILHLQTTDDVQITQTNHSWHATLSRNVSIGMDAKAATTFDASLIDHLPPGMQLLSPGLGTMMIQAIDKKDHPLTLSLNTAARGSNLKLDFHGLPSLPEGQQCCDCNGTCGRACSAEFSYTTQAPYMPGQWGKLQAIVLAQ